MGLNPSLGIEKGTIGSEVENVTNTYTKHEFDKGNKEVVFSGVKWWTEKNCDLACVEFYGWDDKKDYLQDHKPDKLLLRIGQEGKVDPTNPVKVLKVKPLEETIVGA